MNNAYVNLPEKNIWNGVRTNGSGRFKMSCVPADSKLLIAWSQRSGRMTVIEISLEMPGDRHYPLDCRESSVEGRVVDPNKKAIEGVEVTFHMTGPRGLSFRKTMWQKTNAEGDIREWSLPAGEGWTVSASLPDGETTAAVAITHPQVELPDLVQKTSTTDPAAKSSPELAIYSGRVVDENAKSIAGVNLQLSAETSQGMRNDCGAVTGADGRWSRRMRADLRKFEIRLDHPDFIGFEFDLRQPSPPMHALRDGSAIQVMKRGLRITGTVRDSSGAAVGNALVLAGQFYSRTPSPEAEPIEDATTARTVRDGTFSIGGIPSGLQQILVLADGFAPAQSAVTLADETTMVDFVLDRGRTVTGRIVDEARNPIANARVGVEDWKMPNAYRRPLGRVVVSQSDGRFAIPAMPRQGSLEGFVSGRKGKERSRLSIQFGIMPGADDVGDVPLYPYPVIVGKVVDAETGTPITKFTVTDGRYDEDGRFIPAREPIAVDSGTAQFERTINWIILTTDRKVPFAVKIAAIGYAPAMTPAVEPGQAYVPVLMRLKKAAPIRGIVNTPDGRPAGDAKVYFVGPQNDTWVRGTTLDESSVFIPDVRTTAKDDGSFELVAQDQNGRLLMLHGAGYAIVPTDDYDPHKTTTLIPWARIEGNYRPSGIAQLGVAVTAEAIRPLAAMASRDNLLFLLNVTTDGTGRFVIEHVPAMQLRVGAHAGFGFGASKLVRIEPGRTNIVALADDGPAVSGRVNLSEVVAANPPPAGLKFDTSTSWVRAIRVEPKPGLPNGADAIDWEAQLKLVLDGRASDELTLPATFAELKADGSFAFDALAPGRYLVFVDIHGERPPDTCGWGLMLAKGSADFTVANSALALPIIELTAPAHPQCGSQAPEVSGTTADGESFTLSGLHGKYVVLDFWAGWCAPCRASQPALQALHAKHKDQVTFVGLNFDYSELKANKAIASIKSPWRQVLRGRWDANNATLTAYGVEVIPSVWLIDANGKVVGKHLSLEDLEKTLADPSRK